MIRAEYRKFYGREWKVYRARLLEVRGAWCRDCGRTIAKYANLSHDTHDPMTSSVTVRCPGCHTRRDSAQRCAVTRRRRAAQAGQLWLWAEVEFAATPAWAIPRAALAQGELFA
jgi:hypothetical protein